jgi:hypothetical protein
MMKILPLFKALTGAILLSTLLIIVYGWNRDTSGRQVRERGSLYQHNWSHLVGLGKESTPSLLSISSPVTSMSWEESYHHQQQQLRNLASVAAGGVSLQSVHSPTGGGPSSRVPLPAGGKKMTVKKSVGNKLLPGKESKKMTVKKRLGSKHDELLPAKVGKKKKFMPAEGRPAGKEGSFGRKLTKRPASSFQQKLHSSLKDSLQHSPARGKSANKERSFSHKLAKKRPVDRGSHLQWKDSLHHLPAAEVSANKKGREANRDGLLLHGKEFFLNSKNSYLRKNPPIVRSARKKKKTKNVTDPHYNKKEIRRPLPQLQSKKQVYYNPLNSQKYFKPNVQHSLSPIVISKIKQFVFFVGYARSGHSIIGTLLDAHPHIIISNEFNLFDQFSVLDEAPLSTWKENLFNLIYRRSRKDLKWSRSEQRKGYDLKVDGLWQGKFNHYIEVIGDKSGDITTRAYNEDSETFLRNYWKLKSEVSVPLRIIHTVRNPFDIVSTSVVINSVNRTRFKELKRIFVPNSSHTDVERRYTINKFNNTSKVHGHVNIFFKRIDAVTKLIDIFGRENVLDVHNCDLVSNPRATLSKILNFLGVAATHHYMDACAAKVFKSPSRSRNMVVWTPEQISEMEDRMSDYQVLDRYSFTSD